MTFMFIRLELSQSQISVVNWPTVTTHWTTIPVSVAATVKGATGCHNRSRRSSFIGKKYEIRNRVRLRGCHIVGFV